MKNKDYQDLIARIGYFRNKKNISARELSLMLDKSESYIFRIESGQIKLSCQTLFEIVKALNITINELFYYDPEKFDEDKELLDIIKTMNKDDKSALVTILQIKQK